MVIITAGTVLLLYPHAADWFVTRNQSGEIARHTQALNELTQGEMDWMVVNAHDYNRELFAFREGRPNQYDPVYRDLLRAGESNIMGQVFIPSIGVTEPVFHGVSS